MLEEAEFTTTGKLVPAVWRHVYNDDNCFDLPCLQFLSSESCYIAVKSSGFSPVGVYRLYLCWSNVGYYSKLQAKFCVLSFGKRLKWRQWGIIWDYSLTSGGLAWYNSLFTSTVPSCIVEFCWCRDLMQELGSSLGSRFVPCSGPPRNENSSVCKYFNILILIYL